MYHSLPIFPFSLDPPVARSLSMQFILQELIHCFQQTKTFSLDKLCFYCEILLQASRIEENEPILILEEMKHQILRKKPVADLQQKLVLFFDSLIPFFHEARSDENVLFYFIENKERLNSFLGSYKIENMLQSFFPSGFDQLRSILIEGYTRRGFISFLSQIEPLIDAMEWEATCLTP